MPTLTTFPDPSTGSTTVDGRLLRSTSGSFDAMRNGAGETVDATVTDSVVGQLQNSVTSNEYEALSRGAFGFNTASVGSGSSIDTLVFSIFGSGLVTTIGSTPLHVTGIILAANNSLATADFANILRVTFGNVTSGSYSTVAYNDITLNADGRKYVNKIGVTNFATQLEWDLNNSFTGVAWGPGENQSYYFANYADFAGTTNDPKLTVTYTLRSFMAPNNLRPAIFKPGIGR